MARFRRCAALLALGLSRVVSGEAPGAAERPVGWTAPPFWTAPAPASAGRAADGRQALANGGGTPLPFVAVAPCRLVDTRGNAPLTGGFLPPATVRTYTVTGSCGIPASAQAVSLNATVVLPTGPGFLTLFPEGGAFPPVSTLNYLGNDVVVNAAVVPLSGTGGLSMALGVSGGDVILDVNGYYAPTPSVTSLNALTGDVALAAGANVTLTPAGNTLTVAAAGPPASLPPSGPAGGALAGSYPSPDLAAGAVGPAKIAAATVVRSLNGLTENVSLTAGNNITITPSGNNLVVASPAASSAFFAASYSAPAGSGVAIESSCASGTVVHGACGYINLDVGLFDVRVVYAGPSGANWRCVAVNSGAVARLIQYGVRCSTALTAAGSPLPTESQARASGPAEGDPGIVVQSIQVFTPEPRPASR